jgi:hypothetical protein
LVGSEFGGLGQTKTTLAHVLNQFVENQIVVHTVLYIR